MRTGLEAAQTELQAIPAAALTSYAAESAGQFKEIQKSDLDIVVGPYALMGGILIVVLGLFAWKLPKATLHEGDNQLHLGADPRPALPQQPLHRRRDCPNILCRCPNHVLDLHHPVRGT